MKTKTRQREFGFTSWGGKRRGAGRKPKGERAGVSHAPRAKLAARFPVLVTMRLLDGLPTLRAKDLYAALQDAFTAGSKDEFRVVEHSVQSNHLHLMIEAKDERTLARGMNGLAVRIAKRLNRLRRRVGRVFADRYHARILRTPSEVRRALVYLLQNARKHGAWVARMADVYSSGPMFDGWRRDARGADSSPRLLARGPLARAKTWLLAVGWRRFGLIGLLELPKGAVEPRPASACG
jgi:REP element-mobilizing transposase RayT